MQLTKFSDYSLRVLISLARRPSTHTTIHEIAAAHQISENHLMKVVNQLAKLGYVKAVRGKGGGISLARPAAEISIGRLVRDVEPLSPAECFAPDYHDGCKLYPECRLRGALAAAQNAFLSTLDGYHLSEVAGTRRG
jgi:Rrf2 family nitric oxide-sensitive transcriptional repressor